MLLCEVLGVELRDDRICLARSSAMELVADTRLEETAGYTWALSVGRCDKAMADIDAC